MSDNKKSYYAIIPANVRYDENITPNAKLLYGEVTALCNEKGYCWASNSYFAQLYGVSNVSISKWINQLVKNGYLSSELHYKEGTKEILNRYLRIVNDPIKEKFNTPQTKVNEPIKEKFKDNNTSNNTSNNTNNKTDGNPSKNELKKDFEELWKKYPNKQGKQKAFKSYEKAIKDGVDKETISKGIDNFIEYCNQNKWYTPAHGSSWFNQRRWEDDYNLNKPQVFTNSNDAPDGEITPEMEAAYYELMKERGEVND